MFLASQKHYQMADFHMSVDVVFIGVYAYRTIKPSLPFTPLLAPFVEPTGHVDHIYVGTKVSCPPIPHSC
jgi:hypothetical protein